MSELKPCPFCGGAPYVITNDSYGNCAVGCNCLEFAVSEPMGKLDMAKARWNTRAAQPPEDALVAEACDFLRRAGAIIAMQGDHEMAMSCARNAGRIEAALRAPPAEQAQAAVAMHIVKPCQDDNESFLFLDAEDEWTGLEHRARCFHDTAEAEHVARAMGATTRPVPTKPAEQAQPPRDVPQWQPIASAPKGLKILIAYRNSLGKWRRVLARWYEADELETCDSDSESGYAPAGWYEECETQEDIRVTEEQPEFWQNIPAPPSTKDAQP